MLSSRLISHDSIQLLTTNTDFAAFSILLYISFSSMLCFWCVSLEARFLFNATSFVLFPGIMPGIRSPFVVRI